MTSEPADRPPIRPVDLVKVVAAMAVLAFLVGKVLERDPEGFSYPPPPTAVAGGAAIPAEANLFATGSDGLAVAPDFAGDVGAHPRTLEMYRGLRAYPGAPPRIPHGLTDEEFASTACNTCHRRGGWAARFGAFAPLTPHPEYASCLQCHAPRDELVGTALPASEGSSVCLQCHVDPDAPPELFAEVEWRQAAWPETDVQAMPGSPHVIPHDVSMRTNCLACHGGPAAIAGLRTDHPERVHCRQCHVPSAGETRAPAWPPDGPTPGEGRSP